MVLATGIKLGVAALSVLDVRFRIYSIGALKRFHRPSKAVGSIRERCDNAPSPEIFGSNRQPEVRRRIAEHIL
jgi:hypothetical protein